MKVDSSDKKAKVGYYDTSKFKRWLHYMQDDSDELTFQNQTQSAIKAYSLDPHKQYNTASVIGSKNIRKVKEIASKHYEELGISTGRILDEVWRKAVKSRDVDLLVWVCQVMDIELPLPLPTSRKSRS